MTMHYIYIPPRRVERVWPHIAAWIDRARAGDDFFSGGDVYAFCLQGKMELWVVMDNTGQYYGFLIGRKLAGALYYVHWFGGREGRSWIAGGRHRLEQRARETGCSAVGFAGRRGLGKLIGYAEKGVYYQRQLA